VEVIGGLPVVAAFLQELEFGKIINETVPWEGGIPLGPLAEFMVVNRLLHPQAQWRLGAWAEATGLTDFYGVSKEALNDDLLGRALERLAAHHAAIDVALVLAMIRRFGLRVVQIHYDLSDVELYGAYDRQLRDPTLPPDPCAPQPAYGRPKSGRRDLKRIQFGVNVTSDGAVPLTHRCFDGNTAEVTTHLGNLQELRRFVPRSDFLYIADSKLDDEAILLDIDAHGGKFLCAGALLPHLQAKYLEQVDELQDVDYCPQSQAALPPERRDRYRAFELREEVRGLVQIEVNGAVKQRRHRLRYRQIFVWSEAKARQEAVTRERHMEAIRAEFAQVERTLNKYSLKTAEAVIRRLEQAKGRWTEGALFGYEVRRHRGGRLSLTWQVDEEKLARSKQLEGVYLLKTNMPKATHPIVTMLKTYKEQIHVERRIGNIKGPLAVAPMFLEKPERMAGVLCIVLWALTVLALMERTVRANLNGKPLYGLYPENRPCRAPTAKGMLDCFAMVSVVTQVDQGRMVRTLADFTPIQQELIHLLNISASALQRIRRRCERGPPS
jgi:transposase